MGEHEPTFDMAEHHGPLVFVLNLFAMKSKSEFAVISPYLGSQPTPEAPKQRVGEKAMTYGY